MDDRDTALLLPGSDDEDDGGPRLSIRNIVISILFIALIIAPSVYLVVYGGLKTLENIGRLKFSMEPVAYTGLGFAADGPAPAASSPSLTVTLRAKSTYAWGKFCSVKEGRMVVSYSGVPIAVTNGVKPFCVDAGGEKVIAATVSSGWPALPDVFQERMLGDWRHGGVQIQVDFISFRNKDHAHPNDELITWWWVRCPTMLNSDQPSLCRFYTVRGCFC